MELQRWNERHFYFHSVDIRPDPDSKQLVFHTGRRLVVSKRILSAVFNVPRHDGLFNGME